LRSVLLAKEPAIGPGEDSIKVALNSRAALWAKRGVFLTLANKPYDLCCKFAFGVGARPPGFEVETTDKGIEEDLLQVLSLIRCELSNKATASDKLQRNRSIVSHPLSRLYHSLDELILISLDTEIIQESYENISDFVP
jgi:hypothetical protein